MISCIVLNNPFLGETLNRFVKSIKEFELLESFDNFETSLKFLENHPVDVAFVGFQLNSQEVALISSFNLHIIFHADQNISEVGLRNDGRFLHWLDHPLKFPQFLNVCHQMLAYIEYSKARAIRPDTNGNPDFYVKTESKGKFIRVVSKDISFVEGLGNYVVINTVKGAKIITYTKLTELASILSTSFVRVHKSFIVSLEQIDSINCNELKLRDRNEGIPIGITYRDELYKYIYSKTVGGKCVQAASNNLATSAI